jgi:undecaprenyl-diphosphatase
MISEIMTKWQGLATFFVTLDRELFRAINQVWVNATFDQLMPWITNFRETEFIGIILVGILIYRLKRKAVIALSCAALAVCISDLTAARIIKPLVQRPRPQFSEPHVRLLVPPQASYSFPSNHAANVFAAATVLGMMLTGLGPFVMFIAFLVAYSRVYVGVHYPLDVVGGGLLGFLAGLFVVYLFKIFRRLLFPSSGRKLPKKWVKKNRGEKGDRRKRRLKDNRLPAEKLS